jgi:hypothetical protein
MFRIPRFRWSYTNKEWKISAAIALNARLSPGPIQTDNLMDPQQQKIYQRFLQLILKGQEASRATEATLVEGLYFEWSPK